MLNLAAKMVVRTYQMIAPEAFTARKIKQAGSHEAPKLSGTVADCQVEGNVLVKRIRLDQAEKDRRDVTIIRNMIPIHIIHSWADNALLEYDMLHEAEMQAKFCELWEGDPTVRVPRIHSATEETIHMEYFAWPRFSDCDAEEAREVIGEIFRFFIQSITRGGLVHGDISPYNVLVRDGCVCVLDYGLTAQNPVLVAPTCDPALLVDRAWRDTDFTFTMDWWTSQEWLDPRGDGNVDGVFVRSLMALTRMACLCEYSPDERIGELLDSLGQVMN